MLGAGGYAIRKDLSFLYRFAVLALLALLLAGIVLIFVRIPAAYTIYVVLRSRDLRPLHGHRLQPPAPGGLNEAIPLAAAIFLDVLNIFLFFLRIFGRR